MIVATVVEVGKLLAVVLDALIATVGVTVLFSLAVLGTVRAGERRHVLGAGLVAYAALAIASLGGCAAAVVYGIALLAHK